MKTYMVAGLLGISVLSGCSAIEVYSPRGGRMESPETHGEPFHFFGGVGAYPTTKVKMTGDASARPPDLDHPELVLTEGDVMLRGGLSLTSFLDLSLRTGVLTGTPYVLQAKMQFLGEPMKKSKAGNFSFAATGGLGYTTKQKSGDQNGTFGRGGYRWKAIVQTQYVDGSLIAGYRLTDRFILFGGPFVEFFKFNLTLDHEASDDGQSPAASYSREGSGRNAGVNFDAQVILNSRRTVLITFETGITKTSYTNNPDQTMGILGVALDLYF